MMVIIVAAYAFAAGMVMGSLSSAAYILRLRRWVRELRAIINGDTRLAKLDTMKRFVWACVLNGFAWVRCSYTLAALDKVQIAEELSKVALVEIIVPVAVYEFKSTVENLSKNNRWPDKQPADTDPPPDQDNTDGGGFVG